MIKLDNNVMFKLEEAHMATSEEWKNQLAIDCGDDEVLLYSAFNPFQASLDDFLLPEDLVHTLARSLHDNKIKDFTFCATVEYAKVRSGGLDICRPHLHVLLRVNQSDEEKVESLIGRNGADSSGFTEYYFEHLRSISQAIKYNTKQLKAQENQGIKPLVYRYTSTRFSDLFLAKKTPLRLLRDYISEKLITPLNNACLRCLNTVFTGTHNNLGLCHELVETNVGCDSS